MLLRNGSLNKAAIDYNIGNTLSALKRYTEAVAAFDLALSAEPNAELASQIWKNRGTCFYNTGDHEEEFRSYQTALELDPKRWQAYYSWAITEMHLGNHAHAQGLLEKAAEVNPTLSDNPDHLYSLALTHWHLGNMQRAYDFVNKALATKPEHRSAWLLKTRLLSILWRQGSEYINSALRFFRARIIDSSDDMFAKRELYLILSSKGYLEAAQELVKKSAPSYDASPPQLYQYAVMLEHEGSLDEAVHYLEAAFVKSQEHAIVHKLALLQERTKNYEEAIDLYKLIVSDDPISIQESISNCYYQLGNYLECIRYCTRLILLKPDTERWWNNLGYAALNLDLPRITGMSVIFSMMAKATPDSRWAILNEHKTDLLLHELRGSLGDDFVASVISP